MGKVKIWIVICLWLATVGMTPGASEMYIKATKFAKTGQNYFAFMQFNNLLRNFPDSKYRQRALFATGEYYFELFGFDEAVQAFETYIAENPDSQEKLYALAYLLNIAKQNNNESITQELEKKIVNLQKVSFVFREQKEIAYLSPLNKNYKAVIHIDNIECFVEGELLAQVSF